ncbi:hypothetical protein ASPWEDRAFT_64245 [Aspergillus wentii DTO 134E9]|uniref:Dickkopf N-terminal cysteine-rich domain-containing protein n=1 Tax=Aspergillus wentii DTO 134E9 TaxID=1073089 RepID=A0A1L9S193_ASPWE|nr:uncharacterized protein ASPWEDRAFT_64245 [Aspergillus wentii DTO 134E9]KAI9931098.1 hypothetical protein MW887_010755 [Aspergillus wentii]OJJ40904.1 hypothetical protein ASPWEDRAFT_64245 [Aspergillus wentii DTO 134E9]
MRLFTFLIAAFIGSALAAPSPNPEAAGDLLSERAQCAARGGKCANDAACCVSLWCIDGKCVNQGSGKRELERSIETRETSETADTSSTDASGCAHGSPCLTGWICQDNTCVPKSARDLFRKEACRGELTSCGANLPPCCKDFHCDQGYCIH